MRIDVDLLLFRLQHLNVVHHFYTTFQIEYLTIFPELPSSNLSIIQLILNCVEEEIQAVILDLDLLI